MDPVTRVEELAAAIADGRPATWTAADAGVGVVRQLHAVRTIASWLDLGGGGADDAGAFRLEPGAEWGGLIIRERIGRGAFGDVYRALDPALEREVALKLLIADDAPVRSVVEEARAMARVRHPNVVMVFGAQRVGGRTGLWMELVDGESLDRALRDGPLPADEIVRIGRALCAALAAVHAAGIVHRDVKTHNVMRDVTGRILLGDFGTGLDLDRDGSARGVLAGTPVYVAPELFAGAPATPRSDLYSLGVLLFRLATGRYPVEGRTLDEVGAAHRRGSDPDLAMRLAGLPAPLRHVVERAMQPSPVDRFESALAMEQALAGPADEGRRARSRRVLAVTFAVAPAIAGALALASRPTERDAGRGDPAAQADRPFVILTTLDDRVGNPQSAAVLTRALQQGLSAEFSVSPERVGETLQLMRRPSSAAVDVPLAREIAVRAGSVRGIVAARVERVDGVFRLTASVFDPAGGDPRAAAAEWFGIVDEGELAAARLASRVAPGLRALPAARPSDLPRVTTTSLTALRHYAAAWTLHDAMGLLHERDGEAERLLRLAIAEDPEFSSAYMRLNITVRLNGERLETSRLAESVALAERAVALADHVSPLERLLNEGEMWAGRASLWRDRHPTLPREDADEAQRLDDRGIAMFRAALELDPVNEHALACLANLLRKNGQPDGDVVRRLATVRPDGVGWQVRAVQSTLREGGDFAAARPFAHAGARLPVTTPSSAWLGVSARLFDSQVAWFEGRAAEALRIADETAAWTRTLPLPLQAEAVDGVARAYVQLGRIAAARQVLAPFREQVGPYAFAMVDVLAEDRTALAAALTSGPLPGPAIGNLKIFAAAGPVPAAAAFRKEITQAAAQSGSAMDAARYDAMLDGLIALQRGDAAEGAARLQRAHDAIDMNVNRPDWLVSGGFVAEARAAAGDLAGAIDVLQLIQRRPDIAGMPTYVAAEWLAIRDRLAVFLRQAGRVREAEAVDAELRRLLAVADADHPIRRRLQERAAAAVSASRATP